MKKEFYCATCSKKLPKVKFVNGVPYCADHAKTAKEYADNWFKSNGHRMN